MSIAKFHADWMNLIEKSGPFLSIPVLKKVFPQGLDAHDSEHFRLLRQVHEEWIVFLLLGAPDLSVPIAPNV